MRIWPRYVAACCLLGLGVSACSGGGSTASAPATVANPTQPVSNPSTTSSAMTYPLGSAAATDALPAAGGISGTVSLGAPTTAVSGTLSISATTSAPAGAPLTQSQLRAVQTGTLTVLYYATFTPSVSVTFGSLPGFTIMLPSTVDTSKQHFYYAVSDPTVTGVPLEFTTQGPAKVSGSQLTFAPSNYPLTLQAGLHYIFAFYATSTLTNATPSPVSLQATTVVPNVGSGQPIWVFDIGYVDQSASSYYLADRTNASLDIFSTKTNALVKQVPGFVGIRATSSVSGPDGVQPIGNNLVAVGDGDSTVKLVDTLAGTILDSISTGGTHRVDEMTYDPNDALLIVANNADTPPFVSFISTTSRTIVGKLVFTTASGIEQPRYDPGTRLVYQSVPGTTVNPGGEVDVIDPVAEKIVYVIPVPSCSPSGLSFGPNENFAVGCNGISLGYKAQTVILNALTKQTVALIPQIGGADEVWYNPGDNNYYVAGGTMTSDGTSTGSPAPALGIIDAGTNAWIENVPTAAGNAHSVAVDPVTNHAFVPLPPSGLGVFGTH